MAIDLVCGMIVDENSAPAKTTYEETDYYFCATYCREAFDREPQIKNLSRGPSSGERPLIRFAG
jgi:YHS domain-containing protein